MFVFNIVIYCVTVIAINDDCTWYNICSAWFLDIRIISTQCIFITAFYTPTEINESDKTESDNNIKCLCADTKNIFARLGTFH